MSTRALPPPPLSWLAGWLANCRAPRAGLQGRGCVGGEAWLGGPSWAGVAGAPSGQPVLGEAGARTAGWAQLRGLCLAGSPASRRPLYLSAGSLSCLSHLSKAPAGHLYSPFPFPSASAAPFHRTDAHALAINSASAPLLRRASPQRSSAAATGAAAATAAAHAHVAALPLSQPHR